MIQLPPPRYAFAFACFLTFSATWRPAAACEIDAVQGSWILPNRVVGYEEEGKKVAAVVACGAFPNADGQVDFAMNLIDADVSVGEAGHGSDSDEDDVLDRARISGRVSGNGGLAAVVGGQVYAIYCESGVSGSNGEGEGSSDPADLALQIVNDRQGLFSVIPSDGAVPARCTFHDRAAYAISVIFTGAVNKPRFPELPPTTNLPYGVRLNVKSGEAHFEFITDAAGPFPDFLTVDVTAGPSSPQQGLRAKTQDAPRILTVSGDGPFVDVVGTVSEDGVVEASGRGTVAGYPDIAVTLTGTLHGGVLDAEYAMGAEGGLPGGFAIVFELNGESDDIAAFWQAAGDGIVAWANELARFHAPVPAAGVDFEDALVRLAVNLTVAQAGLRELPQNGIPEAAFAGIATRLDELANAVAASTLASRDAAEASLREAAQASAEAGERVAGFIQGPPGEDFNAGLAGWTATMDRLVASLGAFGLAAFSDQGFVSVSAASFADASVAPDSIVSGFGLLGAETAAADALPLPTELGGVSLQLTDSAGREFLLGMFFSSGGQLNFLVPAGVSQGPALLTVLRGETVVASGVVFIDAVAPSLFTANADGAGVPAAFVQRVSPDGVSTFADAFTSDPPGARVPVPIDPSDDASLYFLNSFGTGFRNASQIVVRIDGEVVEGVAIAASSQFVGLDQANVPLGQSFRGRGTVTLEFEADGVAANSVEIAF